ncbi:hypothetical protein GCM10028792_40000 [Salinisphaera aquimarina]
MFAGLTAVGLFTSMNMAWADAFATPIGDQELNAQRGREGTSLDLTAASSHLEGTLTGNVASGTTNGQNVIKGAAFSGLNGHATVIQNSGNNNIIQDSTIYNFSMRP